MDNAQKAIMIGVGLFITIIVIAAVMLITGMGQDMLNSGTQQLGTITTGMNSGLYEQLDSTKNSTLSKSSARTHAATYIELEGVTMYVDSVAAANKLDRSNINSKLTKSTYKVDVTYTAATNTYEVVYK